MTLQHITWTFKERRSYDNTWTLTPLTLTFASTPLTWPLIHSTNEPSLEWSQELATLYHGSNLAIPQDDFMYRHIALLVSPSGPSN